MPLVIVKPKEKYSDFPCVTCPFSRDFALDNTVHPLCSIYGGVDGAGLQSCQELKAYCEKTGFTFEKDVQYFFRWEIN